MKDAIDAFFESKKTDICSSCSKPARDASSWFPFFKKCGDCFYNPTPEQNAEMIQKMYQPCLACAEHRANNNFPAAEACHPCKGKGFYRDAESYICNMCAGPMTTKHDKTNAYGMRDAKVSGGYSSEHLLDVTTYYFSLCELCLRNMFNQFKVPPDVVCGFSGRETFEEDQKGYENSIWRNDEGEAKKLAEGLCTFDKFCQNPAKHHNLNRFGCALCEEHHKLYNGSSRDVFVDHQLVADVPFNRSDRTSSDKCKLADIYLNSFGKMYYHRNLPEFVKDVLDEDHNEIGGIWTPYDVCPSQEVKRLFSSISNTASFKHGYLRFENALTLVKKIREIDGQIATDRELLWWKNGDREDDA